MKKLFSIYIRSIFHSLIVFFYFIAKRSWLSPSGVYKGMISKAIIGNGVRVKRDCVFNLEGNASLNLGNRVWISHSVEVDVAGLICIGDDTTVQRRATLNGNIKIGRSCIIAPNVFISSGTHPFREYSNLSIREQEERIIEIEGDLSRLDKPISIGDDCWIGVNAVICPGVSIGNGVVIGAGSVVTHDVEDFLVVAGSPARVIGNR